MTAAGRLTQVTLIGPRRRVDLVLPSCEPVGVLLPKMVAMVGHEPATVPRRYQVSLADGRALDPAVSLGQAEVANGTLLRIDPLTDAPPAAVGYDVSGEVATDLADRRGRWGTALLRWTATAVASGAAVLTALPAAPGLPPIVLTLASTFVLLLGTVIALMGRRPVGVALIAGGASLAMTAVLAWTADWSLRWVWWLAGAAVTTLALGIATRRLRADVFGAATLLCLLGLWVSLFAAGLPADRVATLMAVLTIGLLGLLPRAAIMFAGLTRLDDQQSEGRPVPRVAALAAIDTAHCGLALACVAAAASGAVAGWLLGHAPTDWATALACLTGVALLLRLRAYPLTVEVVALVAAALATGTSLLEDWMRRSPGSWWVGTAVVVAVAVIAIIVVDHRPRPHTRARARQLADRFESLAELASGRFGDSIQGQRD